ncbi:MAG: FeoB small GTPase domain-containing protein [Acidiferrobacterales bacterium]
MAECSTSSCTSCASAANLAQMGLDIGKYDYVVALAGNPNTGKSSVFNAITGLNQHTGNWPGKTVTRAEGGYKFNNKRYKLVDLPGTYSLLSAAQDEEIARDFILFGRPDCTITVADATCLERNLNLILQVLEISDKVIVCVNLMDEAKRKGITIDLRALSRDLGVPCVGTVARTGEGLHAMLGMVEQIVTGQLETSPHRVLSDGAFQEAVSELVPMIEESVPGLPNARWVAMRLLDGDLRVQQALLSGELADIAQRQYEPIKRVPLTVALEGSQ